MRALMSPLAGMFAAASSVRECLYRREILKSVRLSKPVISVGNLTVGGTGKSPLVDLILEQLESKGLRCCVLTRGYGRKSMEPLIIGDKTTSKQSGDEPLWLYKRHPRSIIAVGADRIQSAQQVGTDQVDVFILDDGLQHLKIKRDLEVTLLDSTRPLWHYRPLPWGYAREGWKALKRSDLAIVTRVNLAPPEHVDRLAEMIFKQGVKDVIECGFEVKSVLDVLSGKELKIKGKDVFLISAIANPRSFEDLVKQSGAVLTDHKILPDHYDYKLSDILILIKQARAAKAQMILITEKDSVKWKEQLTPVTQNLELPVGVVATSLTFNPGLPDFYDLALHHRH